MITSLHFFNKQSERQYLVEYGKDLLGHYFVKVRYGIKLSIAKTYLFKDSTMQLDKVESIAKKRMQRGYSVE